ncbi:MAG: hypothetical protein ACEPOW_14245 [Bacteroidales bacterium]
MKLKTFKYIILMLLLPGMLLNVFAEENKNKKSLAKTSANPGNYKININNISTIFHSDGRSDIDGEASFIFPKGSNKACVYESGFLWIGKINGKIMMNGSTFPSGLVPGKIGENPESARMYRVRPDWEKGNIDSELGDKEGTEQEIRARYKEDWDNWPVADGAPYDDVNKNGVYDEEDIPGYPGADQTIYFIANATDADKAQAFYGSPPMDVELHVTVWGYKSTGPLGNMIFRRYELINKGTDDIEECYVSMWSDPDVGNAGDDFVGCDTTLSLGFAYNAVGNDATYENIPPATGFDFFQGPMVAGEPTDTAKSGGIKHPGMKNLGLTAFYYFVNENNTPYSDPDLDNYNTGTLYWWNLVRGRVPQTGAFFPVPESAGGGFTKYPLSGDPVTGTGYLDGTIKEAKDRRYGQASGPFLLKAGDKQEIVVAQIAAGAKAGIDNIQAVQLLKSYDQVAQLVYDNDFQVAKAPTAPSVAYSEFDEKLVLNWGKDRDLVAKIESHNQQEYAFQGYNVYQLPSLSATKDEGKLIATWDKIDGIKIILDKEFNPDAGMDLDVAVQKGNDNGVQTHMVIEKDYLTNQKLNNGSKYYFAVSAYAYNPNDWAIPKTLESPLIKVTVVPQTSKLGVRYNAVTGEKLNVTKSAGLSDGSVDVTVIEPENTNGHEYEVNFTEDSEKNISWNVVDKTLNQVVHTGTNQTGNNEYAVVDGLLVVVKGPADKGVRDWEQSAGERKFTWAGGADGLHFEGFSGAIGWDSPNHRWGGGSMVITAGKIKHVLLKFAAVNFTEDFNPTFDPNDPNVSYGYRYLRGAGAPADPKFAPYITNPSSGSYGFQEFAKNVPLSAWDIDDPENPRRLVVGFLENNASGGLVDGKYWPGYYNDHDNTDGAGPREWLWIFDADYSETANAEYQGNAIDDPYPIMYWLTVGRRNRDVWVGDEEFKILANKINTIEDKFTFTAPAPSFDTELAKEDAKEVNVFPNPYYGANPQEVNKYQRFVTFSHLPNKATIRIFNLAGQSVRTMHKNDNSQFMKWNLKNNDDLPVGSGVYVVYVDMPDVGTSKILKVAIIQEQQILDRF